MVTLIERKLRKLISIPDVSDNTNVSPKDIKKVLDYVFKEAEKNRRQPAPPAPIGGISQSAASRKYKVKQETISRWMKKGLIPELLRTKREVYVDEAKLAALVEKYLRNPGQGKKSAAPDQED